MIRPWRMEIGALMGLFVGALLWWSAYESGGGPLQKPHLIVVPAALGILVVSVRNKRKRVGPYHPNTIKRNRSGRP